MNRSRTVHGDQFELAIEVSLTKEAVRTETGVVHEHFQSLGIVAHLFHDTIALLADGEVRGDECRVRAMRYSESVGQRAQPVRATGDEHEVIAPGGKLCCNLLTDAA
jgi:hypothetical protein